MSNGTWNVTRRALIATAAGGIALCSAGMAFAQDYPTKPVTLVVGFPPGGSTDIVGRIIADNMSRTLGQPVIVENRPGASGTVGIAHVANSAPDGYTLGVSGLGASILVSAMGRDTGYDMDSQLDVIGVMGTLGLVIAARKDLEQNTLDELFAYAKEHPGEVSFGTSGVGTPGHLGMEYLLTLADAEMLHIPYQGSTPQMNDALGGHVDLVLLPTPEGAEQVRGGGLKALAVTSPERDTLLPDVPTVSESGFEGYTAVLWNLLVTADGTPADVQAKLSEALNAAMESEEVRKIYAERGLAPTLTTPEEATAFLASEREKWASVITDLGISE
ncbi:Bug family tripartite tricarboxylate transporter substrate binding protein [Frigidibacter oleivorans]|uniref:Bug family tripartite tricarboxylate transporter substrate binding protein n=1 Tax=Frigidibacter oleivorans TaxID=2487129 RepID=UPI0013DEF373|nr:tripartite tricarboxylate transporter substrate binding protein [Frigidibacter oleivorans]